MTQARGSNDRLRCTLAVHPTALLLLPLLLWLPRVSLAAPVEVQSEHATVPFAEGGKASSRREWRAGTPLRFTAEGPKVVAVRLRPVVARPKISLTVSVVRDGRFRSQRTVVVPGPLVKSARGRTPKRDLVVHLEVPTGKHEYTWEIAAPDDVMSALVGFAAIAKADPRLSLSPEIEQAPEPPSALGQDTPALATSDSGAAGARPDDVAPAASGAAASTEAEDAAPPASAAAPASPPAAAPPSPRAPVPRAPGASSLLAGTRKRAFALPVKASGIDQQAVSLLQSELESRLGRMPNLDVVTPADIQALLDHAKAQETLGCEADTACLANLGAEVDTDFLVSTNLGKIGDVVMLSLTIVEPKQGRTVGRATATAATLEALVAEIPTALNQGFGLAGESLIANFALAVPPGGLKIAVMPLASHGLEPGTGRSLTQVVALELKKLDGVSVISQDEIAAMLQLEQTKDAVGCDEASCLAEIGGALGVEYLVMGSVGLLGDTYLVALKLINTEQAQVTNRVSEAFKGKAADLLRAARFAVYQLVGATITTPGRLAVNVSPDEEFALELDGKLLADFAALGQVPPGRHNLRVNAEGYYGAYLETYVEPGLANNVIFELSAIPSPWYKKWWVWTAAAGLVAGGVTAAVLLQKEGAQGPETGAIELQLQRGLSYAH